MKKILAGLLLASIVAMALPSVGLAQAPTMARGCTVSSEVTSTYNNVCACNVYDANNATNNCQAVCCALTMLITVRNWFFWIVLGIALIMLIYGAFTFMTAAGDTEKTGRARMILIYAIVGVAIAYLARVIVAIAMSFLVM